MIGCAIGSVLGILTGSFRAMDSLFSPVLNLFQSVPPVSRLVMSLVWFGFNGKPTVFIVATSSIPRRCALARAFGYGGDPVCDA